MYNLDNCTYYEKPYPHLVVDNFLTDPVTVIENFESKEFFEEFVIKFENNTPQLLTDLKEYFKEMDTTLVPSILFRNYGSQDGIKLIRGSHLDSAKAFNSVVYLQEIYSDKNPPHAGSFQLMEDLDDSKEPIKQIDYKYNRAIFFQNTNNSYHRFWSRYPNRMLLGISYSSK